MKSLRLRINLREEVGKQRELGLNGGKRREKDGGEKERHLHDHERVVSIGFGGRRRGFRAQCLCLCLMNNNVTPINCL